MTDKKAKIIVTTLVLVYVFGLATITMILGG
jgi:hypothetical protein